MNSQVSNDPFVSDINRHFRRNLRFWAIRWTVGIIAMSLFAYHFPMHWWIILIGLGMAAISLSVLIIGRKFVLRKHSQKRKGLIKDHQND